MPKEFLYGSDKRVSGYGLILASSTATPEEKKWVSDNSVYTRIGSREESPVSWAFSLAGNNVFLSRSCASVDYSGRPSFLASHLELSQEETLLYEDGPVYVLSRYRFTPQSSDEAGLERNTRQFLNRYDGCREENSRCGTWQSILYPFELDGRSFAGAAALLVLRGNPVYLVYSQNQREDILPLFRELWSLLPVTSRWKYTFNTYLSNPGMVYSLNGLLKETDTTAQFCQSGKVFYLDLSTGTHNFPAEIFEISNLSGIEHYLMTGNVTEAQTNYEQTPDFPVPCGIVWEEQTGLVRKLHEDFQKVQNELAAETSRMNSELSSLKEANSRYKSSAERMRNELTSLETKLKEENEKQSNLQHANDALTRRNVEIKQEIEQAQNQFQTLITKLNEARKSYDELTEQSQTLTTRLEQIRQEIQSESGKREELKADILKNNALKTQLLRDVNNFTNQNAELQAENTRFREEQSELISDLQFLRTYSQKKKLLKNLDYIHRISGEVLEYVQTIDQEKKLELD